MHTSHEVSLRSSACIRPEVISLRPSACIRPMRSGGHQHAYVRREEPLEAWLHEQRPAMRPKVDLEQRTPKGVVHYELYPIDPRLEVESLDGDRDGRTALRFGRGVRQVRRHRVVTIEAFASVSGRAQGATEDAAVPDCCLRVHERSLQVALNDDLMRRAEPASNAVGPQALPDLAYFFFQRRGVEHDPLQVDAVPDEGRNRMPSESPQRTPCRLRP